MVAVDHPLVLVADGLVVVALLGAAVAARTRARATSVLLAIAAVAWLLGGALAIALFWHRALLVHLLLAHPGWRPASRPATAVVASAYLVCLLFPVLLATEAGTWVTAAVLPAAAAWNLRRSVGLRRHLRRSALVASLLVSGGLVVGSLLRLVAGPGLDGTRVLVYDTSVVLAVAVLAAGLRPPEPAQLTDLVVDLGEDRSTPLRDALASTLHDPDLVLGYWDPEAGVHLDHTGRRLPPEPPPGRALLPLERDGRPFALLQVDADLARDPAVVDAVAVATRVVELNDTRQAEVLTRLEELQASRRRLLAVADEERGRLETDLDTGVVAQLQALTLDLARLDPEGRLPHLVRAREHLASTVDDLREVGAGLRPRDLATGLPRALASLADRSPVAVEVRGAEEAGEHGVPPEVELTVWYLCAEALSNCAKHAPGARATITLGRGDGALEVRVADDGPGGAVPVEHGGLVGLRDRVEALGGRLTVTSADTGTVLVAELPLQ